MGRKTYESIGKALPGRLNIVLSQQVKLITDVTVVQSLVEAMNLTKNDVEPIGGSSTYVTVIGEWPIRIKLGLLYKFD